MRLFLVALQFLTRLPVRLSRFEPAWLNDCVRHFPLVGALVGLAGATVLWAASQLWPAWVAAVLALMATVAITGGFHEDGLADTFDALGGVVPRERALEIMKDSRIGSYGALALGLSLLLRVALLASLAGASFVWMAAGVIGSHALGRMAAVSVMVSLPYGGDADHAKVKPLALAVGLPNALMAMLWCVALLLAACLSGVPWSRCAAAVAAAAAVAVLMRQWLRRRLGGYTGDGLGATEQLTEMAVLLVFAASGAALG